MTSTQCLGITQKGKRCLKKVSDGKYCIYHQSQSPKSDNSNQLPLLRAGQNGISIRNDVKLKNTDLTNIRVNSPEFERKAGYIYVYTLSSFLSKDDKKGGWIQARNLINPTRNVNKWVDVNIKKLDLILIKVGMTTKTPAVRIMQWQMKCNHELTCLYPESHSFGGNSFLEAFKRLKIKSKSFENYQKSTNGFYAPKNIAAVEKQIHTLLKKKYGRGEIQCTGCIERNEKAEKLGFFGKFSSKKSELSLFNVHNEWFPIPKRDLQNVFETIDMVCKTQN